MLRFLPIALLALAALFLLADAAAACAVCAGGEDDRSRDTYILMTIVMSVLPVSLVGGLVWYVRRRVKALDALDAARPGPAAGR